MLWLTLKKLRSKSPEARKAAVEKLRSVGGPTVLDPLLEAIQDESEEVREAAAEALGENRDPRSFRALLGALSDAAATVRSAAAGALRRHGDASAVDPLRRLLEDSDSAVRDRALVTLRALGWHDAVTGPASSGEAAPARRPAPVESPREPVSAPTHYPAAPPAPKRGRPPRAAEDRATPEDRRPPPVDVTLLGGLESVLLQIREGPVPRRVGMLDRVGGAREPSVVEAMLAALSDNSPAVRRAAAGALGKGADPEHFEALVRALGDPEPGVRAAAVKAAGSTGGRRAVDPLLKLVRDPAAQVRAAVAAALGAIHHPICLHPLLEFLQDPDKDARHAAVDGLAMLGDPTALEPMLLALTDSAANVRQAASRALRQLDPFWERSELAQAMIPQFQEALRTKDYSLQFTAMEFLKAVGAPLYAAAEPASTGSNIPERRTAAAEALVSLLNDSEPGLRQMAAEGLGRVGEAQSAGFLVHRLDDPERAVRRSAAKALQLLGWRPSGPEEAAVWHVAREEWDAAVNLGPKAVEPLVATLRSEEPALRRKAVEALRRIGDPRAVPALIGELRGGGGDTAPALAALEAILKTRGAEVASADLGALEALEESMASGAAAPADVQAVRELALAERERRSKPAGEGIKPPAGRE